MLKIKKLKPIYTSILTTYNKYSTPETVEGSDIIDPAKAKIMVKEYQKVLGVGNQVRLVKPGDIIVINPMKYAKYKQVLQKNSLRNDTQQYKNEIVGFDFPIVEVNDQEYLLLDERDILYIVEEAEEDDRVPEKLTE